MQHASALISISFVGLRAMRLLSKMSHMKFTSNKVLNPTVSIALCLVVRFSEHLTWLDAHFERSPHIPKLDRFIETASQNCLCFRSGLHDLHG